MSSRSIPERALARAGVNREALGLLAMGALVAYAFFSQLDAIGNRLTAGLPVTMGEMVLAAVVGTTGLVLGAPSSRPLVGTLGIRLIALLFCWAIVAWTLSEHVREGFEYLFKLMLAILPALCVLVVVDRPARLHAMLWTIVAAGLVAAAIVLIEARTGTRLFATALAAVTADFEGVARSSGGSDQNPTTAAQMLMTSTAIALGLLAAGERRWRIVLLATLALGIAALALMSARSAILGLGAAAGLVLLAQRGKPYFPLLLIGAAVVGGVGLLFAPATLIERFAAIGDFGQDRTLYRRITYLRIGADLIGQSPIWGIGPGNYPLHYLDDAYRYMPGRVMIPRELHNTYLDTATEYGLVGFAIFMALIGHALFAARRAFAAIDPELARAAFAIAIGLSALLVGCFFMPHKDMRYLWLMLALAIQCGRLRAAEEPS